MAISDFQQKTDEACAFFALKKNEYIISKEFFHMRETHFDRETGLDGEETGRRLISPLACIIKSELNISEEKLRMKTASCIQG